MGLYNQDTICGGGGGGYRKKPPSFLWCGGSSSSEIVLTVSLSWTLMVNVALSFCAAGASLEHCYQCVSFL